LRVVKQVGRRVHGFHARGSGDGAHPLGRYAEESWVDEALVTPVPAGLDFTGRASFGLVYARLPRAQGPRGESRRARRCSVLARQAASAFGGGTRKFRARVIACASSDDKLETCKRFGAEFTINYERTTCGEALKNLGAAVDVALDPVGGKYSSLRARDGLERTHLVVGFASGEIPKIPLNLTLLKGCSIVGVFWASSPSGTRSERRRT